MDGPLPSIEAVTAISRMNLAIAARRWLIACLGVGRRLPSGRPRSRRSARRRSSRSAIPTEIEVVDNYYFEGYTAAVSSVDIRARVTGYLSKIYFQDGEDVKEGAPLFLIDPRPYQADVRPGQGRIGAGRSAAQAAGCRLGPRRAVAAEAHDHAGGIRPDRGRAARSRWPTCKAREAAIEQANLNLHFAAIKAPITGRISRQLVTEGNLVTANETLLTTIVSIEPIYAYFDVDEPTVLKVRADDSRGQIESAARCASRRSTWASISTRTFLTRA